MNKGLVYRWISDAGRPAGGLLVRGVVDLGPLDFGPDGRAILKNARVAVRNGGHRYRYNSAAEAHEEIAIGNAKPDAEGDFFFEPGKGGGRVDKNPFGPEDFQERYVQASRFGEVNTFYHLSRIVGYAAGLLAELGEPAPPPIVAVVNAHHAITSVNGVKDGWFLRKHTCRPFQGGHYRLPARHSSIVEHFPVAETGEIHLGPGRKLLRGGALVQLAGCPYRANASHNAGIIYHEYVHHLTRHTADFMANRQRRSHRQSNSKPAIDEGTCDYFTAAMLDTPHIWAIHHQHDTEQQHPRSLVSRKTMDDYDPAPEADPHANGTIWGAALWDLRCAMKKVAAGRARMADLLVMKALALTGKELPADSDLNAVCRSRADYAHGLANLREADRVLFDGRFAELITATFAARKIFEGDCSQFDRFAEAKRLNLSSGLMRLPPEEIPWTADILSGDQLAQALAKRNVREYSLIGVGDIMLGDRAKGPAKVHGEDYAFAGVLPLLKRAAIVCGNLEGPLSDVADRTERNFSYRVAPESAHSMKRANITVLNLANNHLTDCGREGILETFAALQSAGIRFVGAGHDEAAAHEPVILKAEPLRIGILGYYWNKRTAATASVPGSAMDPPRWLEADITALRARVDRVVTVFHWGVPYERMPSQEDEAKARLAVDLGADLVVGHHPHVVQKFEVYKDTPIFYSVGNFAFGSGNSKAEGLMVAARFEPERTAVDIYPIYVKNRDPRVNYQPKVLTGAAASRALKRLADISEASAGHLDIESHVGRLRLPRPVMTEAAK